MRIAAVTLALALGACSSTQKEDTPGMLSSAGPGGDQSGLPAQSLEPGECGLFLWSVSGDPQFVFFSKADTGRAKLLLDGVETPLTLTAIDGNIFGQFTTRSVWVVDGQGAQVDLELVPGEVLIDGQRVSGGRLKQVDPEGWETFVPVAGARACMAAPAQDLPPLS